MSDPSTAPQSADADPPLGLDEPGYDAVAEAPADPIEAATPVLSPNAPSTDPAPAELPVVELPSAPTVESVAPAAPQPTVEPAPVEPAPVEPAPAAPPMVELAAAQPAVVAPAPAVAEPTTVTPVVAPPTVVPEVEAASAPSAAPVSARTPSSPNARASTASSNGIDATGRGRFARRRRRRQTGRTIKHVDVWTVAKVSFLLYLVLYGVLLVATVLLWRAAASAGVVSDLEELIAELWDYSDDYSFNAEVLFRVASLGGVVMVVAGTGFNIIGSLLFNLISDVVGGIRVTVVED